MSHRGQHRRQFARILTSFAGTVAWLERSQAFTQSGSSPPVYALYGCVAANGRNGPTRRPHRYAQGDINPATVRLATMTLSWRLGGRLGAAVLSP